MALNVKVLGAGCANCQRVEQQAVAALEILAGENPSLEATIQHVTEHILSTVIKAHLQYSDL